MDYIINYDVMAKNFVFLIHYLRKAGFYFRILYTESIDPQKIKGYLEKYNIHQSNKSACDTQFVIFYDSENMWYECHYSIENVNNTVDLRFNEQDLMDIKKAMTKIQMKLMKVLRDS